VKSFTQVLEEDFNNIYIVRPELVYLICTIAVARGLHLWQIDFFYVFPNSNNFFDVYIEQLKSFEKKMNICRDSAKICTEQCKKYMIGLRISNVHIKTMNIINHVLTLRSSHMLTIMNSYLYLPRQIIF